MHQDQRTPLEADQRPTVWVFGDQLNRSIASLKGQNVSDCRVLFVESSAKISSKRWHIQRAHLVLSAMAHFASELEAEGFEVDYRRASSLEAGVRAHCDEFDVERVIAMEPMSWDGRTLLDRLGVETVANDQFLCSYDAFAEWANGRKSLRMEDFYRWQRKRFNIFMDADGSPVGGAWNFDKDNREPPPKDGRSWPEITWFELDELDEGAIESTTNTWGAGPKGLWPVTRAQALTRLNEFIETGLEPFGPHEDAMLSDEWKLAHSTLSSSLNLGLLHPLEVVQAAEHAYRERGLPINSVEGFIRQVIGWREYVWGMYWLFMPGYRHENQLEAHRALPPVLAGDGTTEMECLRSVLSHVHEHGYAHHIERLMVLGNLALTAGVSPQAMNDWMWSSFVDGAEWVMIPNVIGMALHADGGVMATKPYAAGGAYINKMSNHCKGCRYDPKQRTGEKACPFTTLYWDFLARNEQALAGNHRMGQQLAGMRRLSSLDEVRARATEVLVALDRGEL